MIPNYHAQEEIKMDPTTPKKKCPDCNEPVGRRYPGGDPENGPATIDCKNDCAHNAQQQKLMAEEDQDHEAVKSCASVKSRLMSVAKVAERRNLDKISARIASTLREVSAASSKDSQIEIESWPDFLNWWNNNRGQNLVYIFQDTYGANTPQVSGVRKLVRDSEKHEKELHEFYIQLRDIASSAQPAAPEGGEVAAPEAPAAPAEAPAPVVGDEALDLNEEAEPAEEEELPELDEE